jgi:hypothetical protein
MIRDTLTKLIEKSQEKDISILRDYIGASIVGSECLRKIWYEFKGYEGDSIPTKTRRTFEIGKRLEGLILDWLEHAGLQIKRDWGALHSKDAPELQGHLDSVWMKGSMPHAVIEIKTAKDTSFNTFVSKGLKLWNPQYYAQVQAYMGMSEIYDGYIVVLNKDTSSLSDEQVIFDANFYKALEDKASLISRAPLEPPRINNSPLWYQCKMCKFNKLCHA